MLVLSAGAASAAWRIYTVIRREAAATELAKVPAKAKEKRLGGTRRRPSAAAPTPGEPGPDVPDTTAQPESSEPPPLPAPAPQPGTSPSPASPTHVMDGAPVPRQKLIALAPAMPRARALALAPAPTGLGPPSLDDRDRGTERETTPAPLERTAPPSDRPAPARPNLPPSPSQGAGARAAAVPDAGQLFLAANEARGAGRFDEALRLYKGLQALYPTAAEATFCTMRKRWQSSTPS